VVGTSGRRGGGGGLLDVVQVRLWYMPGPLSVCSFVCLCGCLFARLSVCLFVGLSVCLFVVWFLLFLAVAWGGPECWSFLCVSIGWTVLSGPVLASLSGSLTAASVLCCAIVGRFRHGVDVVKFVLIVAMRSSFFVTAFV
jgi:hypothetical protein